MGFRALNTKQKILDAAENVVIKKGIEGLTLNAVSSEASVSRISLAHHFGDKTALLIDMLYRRLFRLKGNIQRKRKLLGDGQQQSYVTAYIHALLEETDKPDKLPVFILASIANDPRVLIPAMKEFDEFRLGFIRDGLSFERASVILLAIEVFRFLEILSVGSYTGEERERIIGKIMALSKEKYVE